MSDRLRAAFTRQGETGAALGSPFMARLMPLIGARLDAKTAVGARCIAWEGDVSATAQSVPLRLAGALHGLVLDGTDAGLIAAYPPNDVPDDVLWQAISAALNRHETRIMDWLDSAPQTNEVHRAAAVIAGIWWALEQTGPQPVLLSELGASAGLNLSLDRFTLAGDGMAHSPVHLTPEWRGPIPTPHPFEVIDRAGVDLNPLNPRDPADALRLQAYIWPDQPSRMARTRAAIALSDTLVESGDAAPWLARRLAQPWRGLHVVYTTIAAQYFPGATRDAIAATLHGSGSQSRPQNPLLHLALEADGSSPGAALTATLWAGSAPVASTLARVDFHAAWIDWRDRSSSRGESPVGI